MMGVAPQYTRSPGALNDIDVPGAGRRAASPACQPGTTDATTTGDDQPPHQPGLRDQATGQAVSSSARRWCRSRPSRIRGRPTASSVSHQDAELATTISYNLAEGRNLADGQAAVRQAEAEIGMPINVRGSFQGTARAAQDRRSSSPS